MRGAMNPYQLAAWKLTRPPFQWFLRPGISGLENVYRCAAIRERSGAAVVMASNHVSALDPFFNFGVVPRDVLPLTFLAKRELFDRRWKRRLMELLGCLEVGARVNVRKVISKIRDREVIFVFPEGCVSKDGALKEDKGALRFFARYAAFVMLPIYIRGIEGGFHRDWKSVATRRRVFHVRFGEPRFVERSGGNSLDAMEVIRRLRDADGSLPEGLEIPGHGKWRRLGRRRDGRSGALSVV